MRVAVIGAGPSGAAAARVLARAGADVRIYEKSAWPRAKACGDGLTPASLRELRDAGVAIAPWAAFGKTVVSGPDEQLFDARWPANHADGTTMPRRAFDALLVAEAVEAGATFEPRTEVVSCRSNAVEIRSNGSTSIERCDAILLGEGATGGLGAACGLPPHAERLPAYRGYCPPREPLEPAYQVHYAAAVVPGYFWIFPGARAGAANVGAMLVERGDVRARLRAWLDTSRLAERWFGKNAELHDGAGGVIPAGRAARIAGHVFAIGDAAGVADPLTGEGISQAMLSGRFAAEALIGSGGDVRAAAHAYTRQLAAFDRNNREALRMRRFVGKYARLFFQIAARRPAFGDEIIASGYFRKSDDAWFKRSFYALFKPGRR
jgi:geranylgeranyl reductase family protein